MASRFRDTRRRALRVYLRAARLWLCVILASFAIAPARADDDSQPGDIATEAGLNKRIRAAIERAALGEQVGVSVVDVRSGRSIVAHNPMLPLDPASNQKLITAAATLTELGADFRMLTGVYGRQEGDAIVSGLYLKGHGDPSLHTTDLIGLAEQLVARGVRRVDEVVVDGSYFDDRVLPPGFEAQPDEMAAFRAAVAAVSVNANAYTMRILPGPSAGANAAVSLDAEGHFELTNSITTSDGGPLKIIAVQSSNDDKLALRLSGTIALGTPQVAFRRRVESPLHFAGYALVEALRTLRVQVPRRVRVASTPSGTPLLASRRSAPLADLLGALGKYSDNFGAEMLLKVLGAERVGTPGRTEHGARIALQALKRMDVPIGGMRVQNGSGLFAPNRVSAAQLTRMLAAMHNDPAVRSEFVSHLAVGGVDGTLTRRLSQLPSARVVRAKTGTLANVIALSGYVLGRTPERVFAFSVLMNGVRGKHHAARGLADTVAMSAAQHLWTVVPKAAPRSAASAATP